MSSSYTPFYKKTEPHFYKKHFFKNLKSEPIKKKFNR